MKKLLICAMLTMASPSWAAIAIGQHAVKANPVATNVTTLTTTAVNTNGDNTSTYVISVFEGSAIAGVTPVADSCGNTYTLRVSQTSFYFASLWEYIYTASPGDAGYVGGCTSHTATANQSVTNGMVLFLTEITGAATNPYDASGSIYSGNSAVATQAGASVTTTSTNDLILSLIGLQPGTGSAITDTSGWNAILDTGNPTNSTAIFTASNSYIIEATTGTYNDAYAFSPSAAAGGIAIGFKQAPPAPVNGVKMSNGHPVKSGSSILYK